MKRVPLKDLKQNLSSIALLVAKGQTVEVCKHNKTYFYMVPGILTGVYVGKYFGKKSLEPNFEIKKPLPRGLSLKYVLEDREDRF